VLLEYIYLLDEVAAVDMALWLTPDTAAVDMLCHSPEADRVGSLGAISARAHILLESIFWVCHCVL